MATLIPIFGIVLGVKKEVTQKLKEERVATS
jgi:hypothetical protein